MEDLKKLYDALYQSKYVTVGFDEFKNAYNKDSSYRDKIYDTVHNDGLFTLDKKTFLNTYKPEESFWGGVKKKAMSLFSSGEEEDSSSASPSTLGAPTSTSASSSNIPIRPQDKKQKGTALKKVPKSFMQQMQEEEMFRPKIGETIISKTPIDKKVETYEKAQVKPVYPIKKEKNLLLDTVKKSLQTEPTKRPEEKQRVLPQEQYEYESNKSLANKKFLYDSPSYKNINQGEQNKVNSFFQNINEIGIDLSDFSRYLKNKSDFFENSNVESDSPDKIQYLKNKYLQGYIADRKDFLERKTKGTIDPQEKSAIEQEILNNSFAYNNYKEKYLPEFKKQEDELIKNQKEEHERIKNAGFIKKGFYDILSAVDKLGLSAINIADNIGNVTLDIIGADKIADQFRLESEMYNYNQVMHNMNNNGKPVIYKGTKYLVSDNGTIVDTDTGIAINNFEDKKKLAEIYNLSKKVEHTETVYDPRGVVDSFGNVAVNLAAQIYSTASGAGLLKYAGMGEQLATRTSGMLAAGGLTASSVYEDSLRQLRDAGVSDAEAKKWSGKIAITSGLLAMGSEFIIPNANANKIVEGISAKTIIKESIDVLKKEGQEGLNKYLTSTAAQVVKNVPDIVKESLGEGVQEVLESQGQYTVSGMANDDLNKKVLQENFAQNEIFDTFMIAATVGGLAATGGKISEGAFGLNPQENFNYLADIDPIKLDKIGSDLVRNGSITGEQFETLKEQTNNYRRYRTQLLPNIKGVDAVEMTQLLSERDNLELKKKNAHDAFKSEFDEDIKNVDVKIQELLNKSKEDAIQKQATDEGVLGQEKPGMELQGVGEGNAQPEIITEQKETITPEGEKVTAEKVSENDQTYNNLKSFNKINRPIEEFNNRRFELQLDQAEENLRQKKNAISREVDTEKAISEFNEAKKKVDDLKNTKKTYDNYSEVTSLILDEIDYSKETNYEYENLFKKDPRLAAIQNHKDLVVFLESREDSNPETISRYKDNIKLLEEDIKKYPIIENNIIKPTKETITPKGEKVTVNIAPFYNTQVASVQEAEELRKSGAYQQYKQQLSDIASQLGIESPEVTEIVGGYTLDDGTSIIEISNTVDLTGVDMDQAQEYATLVAALSPEVQESSIISKPTTDGADNHTANVYEFKVDNADEAAKSAKESGILNFSIDDKNNTIKFIDVLDFADPELQDKIGNFALSLEQKGINYEQQQYQPVESRYLGTGERKATFRRIKSEGTKTRGSQQNINNLLEKAIQRDAEFQGEEIAQYIGEPVEQEKPKTEADLLEDLFSKVGATQKEFDLDEQVANARVAIQSVIPDVEIEVFDTDEDYRKATGESEREQGSKGSFIKGKIYINKESADANTVAHEVFHALLLSKGGSNAEVKDTTDRMLAAVQKVADKELLGRLKEFSSKYKNSLQSEESIAELFGILADGYPKLNRPTKSIIKKWLDKLAKIFGLKPFTDNEVIDLLNTVSGKVSSGEEITASDINILGLSGKINTDNVEPRKSIIGDIDLKRFPVNKNTTVRENVSLNEFKGKRTNVIESDRLTGAYIADEKGDPMFKFFGGIYYPVITGKWWASRNTTTANKIVKNNNKNRDEDGYIYTSPMIMSPESHMSNQDMFEAVWEFMKHDLISKKNNVTKEMFHKFVDKAFSLKSIVSKSKSVDIKPNDSIKTMIEKLDKVMVGNDKTFSFEDRKAIIKSILGDPKVKEQRNFPSAGSISEVASKFEEEKTKKASEQWDIVMVMRTKGELSIRESNPSDEFYHKSYPIEINSSEPIEVMFLDGAYSVYKTLPVLDKSNGESFSWKEYNEKHGVISKKLAVAQYGRTAKLSSASGIINVEEEFNRRQENDLDKLKQFVKDARDNGLKDDAIELFLKSKGINEKVIKKAIGRTPKPQKITPAKIEKSLKPEKKTVTVNEKTALRDQIRLEAKAALESKKDLNQKRKALSDAIRNLAKSGNVSTRGVAAIVNKIGRVNLYNNDAIQKLVNYTSRVFNDADYADKLSRAKSLKKDIAKLSKSKDKNANLKVVAKKFISIDPSMIEDIDLYNKNAAALKEAVKGSSFKKDGIKLANTVNIDKALEYINSSIQEQEKAMLENKKNELKELFSVDGEGMTIQEINEVLDAIRDNNEVPKKYESIINSAIDKAFNMYKTLIEESIKTGKDPIMGDEDVDVEYTPEQKKRVVDFMNMDIKLLTPSQSLAAVDSLYNFLINKSTANMANVVSKYNAIVGADEVIKNKVQAKQLKKYWSPRLGKLLAQQTTNLNILFERMFKGVTKGAMVEDKSGITNIINGKSKAQAVSNAVIDNYVSKFYDTKPNKQDFNTSLNDIERGMASYIMRHISGTQEEIENDFRKRKNVIKESIDALMEGNEDEVKKAKVYEEVYEKILKDSETIEDVKNNVDPKNLEAIEYWINKWDAEFDNIYDVALSVYNKQLDRDLNYTPDRFVKLQSYSEPSDILEEDSPFLLKNGYTYKKESGSLMKATRPDGIPKDADGNPKSYIDLSFDSKNANALYEALVDINTAEHIRQADAFFNLKDKYRKIVPDKDDANLLKGRFQSYVRNIRNKNPYDNDEMSKAIRTLNRISKFGVGQALGGITQPLKQVIPIGLNTIINSGDLKVTNFMLDKDKMDFVKNSGYGIATRGIESQAQIDSLNKKIKQASESKGQKSIKKLEELNEKMLKIFLVNPDVYIARASWMMYYEQSLKKQGINPAQVDYKNHELNKKAADYAQRMVDRQQNISDPELAGDLFTNKNALTQAFMKTLMPFSSFRVNQSARLGADLATVLDKTATKEDKEIAYRSLTGYAIEMATFRYMSRVISMSLGSMALMALGREEDDDEYEKRLKAIQKGQATNTFLDVLSPIPLADKVYQMGIHSLLKNTQDILEVPEEEQFNIYDANINDFFQSLGMFGISLQRADQLREIVKLARTGKYTDDYGKTKEISEEDSDTIAKFIAPALLSAMGVMPAEVNSVIKNVVKYSKKKYVTPEEKAMKAERAQEKLEENSLKLEAIDSVINSAESDDEYNAMQDMILEISGTEEEKKALKEKKKMDKEWKEQLLIDPDTGEKYDSESDMERYNPYLYQQSFGEGSEWYEAHRGEKEAQKKVNEFIRNYKDEIYGYVEPVRQKKYKGEGSNERTSDTNSDGSKKRRLR